MTPRLDMPDRVWQLINRLLDGTISEGESAELESALLGQAAWQAELLELCQFHALLGVSLQTDRMIEPLRRMAEAPGSRAVAPPIDSGSTGGAVGETAFLRLPDFRGFGLVGLLFTLVLIVGGLSYWVSNRWNVNAELALARVVQRPKAIVVQEFHPSVVRLESGTTRLDLSRIGHVTIDGPAEFEWIEPMRARLSRGRIRMLVTEPSGRGFVVETPNGKVTDLGTEFGLNVADHGDTDLAVFRGEVDLEAGGVPAPAGANSPARRIIGGEGVTFDGQGKLDRLMAIVTGKCATFESRIDGSVADPDAVIVAVKDNLRSSDTKNFYEIVPGGLREDAMAFVDREHEWNGVSRRHPIPGYLIGADYVKPFNEDKVETEIQIEVTLAVPAKLFVFFDQRMDSPAWLTEGFRKTEDIIGLDTFFPHRQEPSSRRRGPGSSVHQKFVVWERVVATPQAVTLGPPNIGGNDRYQSTMYGIAAVRLDKLPEEKEAPPARVKKAKGRSRKAAS